MKTVYFTMIMTTNFSAKLIHLGEKLNGHDGLVLNHCEVGWECNGIRYTSGSRADGTTTMKWDDYFNKYKKRIKVIKEWKIELTNEEWFRLKCYLDDVEGVKYEYSMFLFYSLKLIFGKWFGSKNKKRLYCVEHNVRATNILRKWEKLSMDIWPTELQNFYNNNLKLVKHEVY